MATKYSYNTLEDFLISNILSIDGTVDDGWGAYFPIKGIELEATILFSDISWFSQRTKDLSSTETLIFVNHFFSWISAEAIKGRPCIVDKYIGDEVMIIFSKEFGSEHPFIEALQTARWMGENDAWGFCPHIGIASGIVTVGFVGTPLKYNCSVFGKPVTLASRCASIIPKGNYKSSSIVFPADLLKDYKFEEVLPPIESTTWEMRDKREKEIKGIGKICVREIVKTTVNFPSQTPEKRAKKTLAELKKSGLYRRKL